MAAWPVELPQRLLMDSFQQQFESNTLRTEMDVGAAKLRRRVKTGYRPLSGSVRMTKAQLSQFIDFYEFDIQGGALPFTWIDPIFETVETFRFREPPRWETYGQYYRVGLELEIRVTGVTLPLHYEDIYSLGMTESTGDIVPTSP